jgi:uncharacterized lipoprotein NlpE involved in copper resistance
MRTFQIICLSALLLATISCKKEAESHAAELKNDSVTSNSDTITMPAADAAHNSENSLDWPGDYSGTLPCGDCKGIKMDITINNDKTYSLSVQALGKEDQPRIFKGTFYWDTAKNVITLDAEGDHLKFKVQEGCLRKLDKFGDQEQGGPESAYTLSKILT